MFIKTSSNDSRRMSGSGEMQLKQEVVLTVVDAVNEGDAQGEFSDEEVGTKRTLFDLTFSSILVVAFESQSSMISLMILFRLTTRL